LISAGRRTTGCTRRWASPLAQGSATLIYEYWPLTRAAMEPPVGQFVLFRGDLGWQVGPDIVIEPVVVERGALPNLHNPHPCVVLPRVVGDEPGCGFEPIGKDRGTCLTFRCTLCGQGRVL